MSPTTHTRCRTLLFRPLTIVGVPLISGILVCAYSLSAQVPAHLFGTWELNVQESSQSSTRYKRTTCWIGPWEDGLQLRYDLVGERGGVIHLEWTGRFDGRDYAVQGVDYVLTHAYTWVDDRTYTVLIKVDGTPVAQARTLISSDGQTLTTVTVERLPDGRQLQTTVVYEKK